VSAAAELWRARAHPVKVSNALDVILGGHRDRHGVVVGPGQLSFPARLPVAVYRGDAMHVVGSGRAFVDRKGTPRVRGMWSDTPLGEYVKTLVAQRVLHFADVELETSIDDDGGRVYRDLCATFTLPADPPPSTADPSGAAGLPADPAAELLGLAARIYAAPARAADLADSVIACAVALGGGVDHMGWGWRAGKRSRIGLARGGALPYSADRRVSLGDVAMPALELLLGPEGPNVLAAAVAEYGCRLEDLRAAEVNVDPSGAAIVMYVAGVRRADGTCTTELLGATTGSRIPAGAAVVAGEYGGEPVEVGIWAWPRDPALPALPTASNPVLLAELFREFGLSKAATLDIRPCGYLPSRHAVLEVRDNRFRWFVKVVWPSAVADLRHRHDIACRNVPVPPVLAATPNGVIVLPEATGTPLQTLIIDGDAALPSPEALESVLDALPAELMTLTPEPSHLQMVDYYAGVLRCVAADEPMVLTRLAEVVEGLHSVEVQPEEIVPVHGDFHEAQLFADNGRVTTILDIDTAGPGERSDEWATLLAHLSALALDTAGRETAPGYADAILAHAARRVPAKQLRQRTAAALLGLATGPFRLQQHRWPEHTIALLDLAMKRLIEAR
jgi:streptomycin 6-kinase